MGEKAFMYKMQKLSVLVQSYRSEDGFIPLHLINKLNYSFLLYCSSIVIVILNTGYQKSQSKL